VTIKTVTVEIEQNAYNEIHSALQRFGEYEIGGMLIGYKKGKNHFAVSEATIADDNQNFAIASFIREPLKSMKLLLKTYKNRRHNYIGEWHSHPRFNLYPSAYDVKTMKGILADSGYGVSFALLIITKLVDSRITMAGFLFHKQIPNFVKASISQSRDAGKPVIDICV